MNRYINRYINKDDLIQALDNRDNWLGQISMEQMCNRNFYSLVNSLPEITIPEWIPCSERQPVKAGWYLVTEEVYYSTEKEPRIEVNINEYKDGHWLGSEEDIPMAWMPLPVPYKEGEEE